MKAALAGLRWSIPGALLLGGLSPWRCIGVRLHQMRWRRTRRCVDLLQSQQRLAVLRRTPEIDTFLARYNALSAMGRWTTNDASNGNG